MRKAIWLIVGVVGLGGAMASYSNEITFSDSLEAIAVRSGIQTAAARGIAAAREGH